MGVHVENLVEKIPLGRGFMSDKWIGERRAHQQHGVLVDEKVRSQEEGRYDVHSILDGILISRVCLHGNGTDSQSALIEHIVICLSQNLGN